VTTPSAEITKGHTDTLLSFLIFVISVAKFSYFIIFCASVLGRLWVKVTATAIIIIIIMLCLVLLSTSNTGYLRVARLLLSTIWMALVADNKKIKVSQNRPRWSKGFRVS
jgi:hypothetical protein